MRDAFFPGVGSKAVGQAAMLHGRVRHEATEIGEKHFDTGTDYRPEVRAQWLSTLTAWGRDVKRTPDWLDVVLKPWPEREEE